MSNMRVIKRQVLLEFGEDHPQAVALSNTGITLLKMGMGRYRRT